MEKARRRFSKEFKAQVAIEALKEQKTLNQISVGYGVHQNQISLAQACSVFNIFKKVKKYY